MSMLMTQHPMAYPWCDAAQLLGWPLDRLARIFIRQPTLICYPPATLERNIQQIAQAAGLSKADTLQVLLVSRHQLAWGRAHAPVCVACGWAAGG
jgi:hypothetical protein